MSNGIICLNFKNIMLQEIDISNVKQFEKKNVNSNILYINFVTQLNFRQILKGFLLLSLMNIDVVIIYFVM